LESSVSLVLFLLRLVELLSVDVTDYRRQLISGWGRYPAAEAVLVKPGSLDEVTIPPDQTLICRGEGRSYGDAAISGEGVVLLTTALDRLIQFDASTGIVVAEAGMTIAEILDHFVPLGWFPPVTPGTKQVSLGGAVAADVHGKNHHRDGSIGDHILELEMVLADGSRVRCSPRTQSDLFWATVGGMGLTGVIATVTLRLRPIDTASMIVQHSKAPDLDAAFRWFEDDGNDDQYTVAWIDCLSRGTRMGRAVAMRGHHAAAGELGATGLSRRRTRTLRLPVECPSFTVNPYTVALFNELYYAVQGRKTKPFLADFDAFFYPLDALANWNRLYGRRGFLQYQFVVPGADAFNGVRRVLERVTERRCAIFLAVLKKFGSGNPAPLSFPSSGYTLALDLPMTGAGTLRLLDELDDIVLSRGGRVYLAKDARLAPETFKRMYPRLEEWRRVKESVDPAGRFSSNLSRRVGLVGGPVQPTLSEPPAFQHA
jgi:FAD/FMN-containing dehydrogenase